MSLLGLAQIIAMQDAETLDDVHKHLSHAVDALVRVKVEGVDQTAILKLVCLMTQTQQSLQELSRALRYVQAAPNPAAVED